MSYLAVDCETTGLLQECQVLTAFFIILDENLNEIKSLDLKIRHNLYNVQAKALEINHIDLVLHDKTSKDVTVSKLALEVFLKGYKRLIPIGHNVVFDINMLKANGIFSQEMCNTYLSYTNIDTCVIAQFLKSCGKIPHNTSISLSNLCKYFEVKTIDGLILHNAECDIKMTVNLLKKMQSEVRSSIKRKRDDLV
jgi:DNA polymerase-3 subunit epsilon/ribonuclease T